MLVDMHFHIDSKWHDPELVEKTISDIESHGMLVAANSTDIQSYEETVEIARRSDNIFPAFGILPWYAHEWVDRLDSIQVPVGEVGMLGEIGIDYRNSPLESEPHMQKALFEFFLGAAEKHDLVVNIHVRGGATFDDARDILGGFDLKRVIMHSHYEYPRGMKELVDRGYFFTVGQGFVMHWDESTRDRIVNAVKEIPDDLILVEVDTVPREGWRAPSSMLVGLLERLAEFRRVSTEDLEDAVQKNALRLMKGVEQLNPYLRLLQ